MVGRKWAELRWKVRSLAPPIITNNYDNHLEQSEETEEETDAKAASQLETDDVSQGVCYITLTKSLSYDSLVNLNLNPNQKRRNRRFNSGPFSFLSTFSAHDDPTRFSPYTKFALLRYIPQTKPRYGN